MVKLRSFFWQILTSFNGLCGIICANHCWLISCFCAVHPNNPSSWNTSCIPTQLEHIRVTLLFIFDLY